ncbi:MAG: hypothetical protein IPL62_18500 [Caulobacteraceae bacterium]|nr:hypothetical protein [Caulobacteraceae bacterium]
MAEPGWEEVKRIPAPDGRREVVILRGPHGRYRYDALRWRKYYEPSDADDGPVAGGWWDCENQSGLYETASDAEGEARAATPWLRSSP